MWKMGGNPTSDGVFREGFSEKVILTWLARRDWACESAKRGNSSTKGLPWAWAQLSKAWTWQAGSEGERGLQGPDHSRPSGLWADSWILFSMWWEATQVLQQGWAGFTGASLKIDQVYENAPPPSKSSIHIRLLNHFWYEGFVWLMVGLNEGEKIYYSCFKMYTRRTIFLMLWPRLAVPFSSWTQRQCIFPKMEWFYWNDMKILWLESWMDVWFSIKY